MNLAGNARCANARYNIRYDDGDSETNVVKARVRKLRIAPIKPFAANQRIMANYRSQGRWYPARVSRVVNACCYAVRYDDGDAESCADPVNLRRVPRGECRDANKRVCTRGYTVQANWRGYGRYYAATVTSCEGGMYALTYNDGDRESMIPSSRLRNCNRPAPCNVAALGFRNGQNIFANYQNRGRWYPGRIRTINTQTCEMAIWYSDGDRETGVKKASVCPNPPRWRVGQRVSANWQNRGKWYPGSIAGVSTTDGTYRITYNDGDREASVPCSRIRV